MATTAVGSGPDLVRDAHYHPIAATRLWCAYVAGVTQLAKNTLDARERDARTKHNETTYARGILGRH